jgi:hypothetical protein
MMTTSCYLSKRRLSLFNLDARAEQFLSVKDLRNKRHNLNPSAMLAGSRAPRWWTQAMERSMPSRCILTSEHSHPSSPCDTHLSSVTLRSYWSNTSVIEPAEVYPSASVEGTGKALEPDWESREIAHTGRKPPV